jgi:hypothetical protein
MLKKAKVSNSSSNYSMRGNKIFKVAIVKSCLLNFLSYFLVNRAETRHS